MSAFQYVLYHFLKIIVRVSLRAFYPRTLVLNRRHLQFRGPAILISNHPNTLLDALHVVSRAREPVFFLANASLFRGKWQRRFFNLVFCIPIERPQDTEGRAVRNDDNFARCYAHLGAGGNIWIAPEGGSVLAPGLRPFRTGVARIALGAGAKAGFELGLRIVPVGLTYSSPERFDSTVVLEAGPPVFLRDWQAEYQRTPRPAVRRLTTLLEERTRQLLIDVHSPEEERCLHRLATLVQHTAPLPRADHHLRTKALMARMRKSEAAAPGRIADLSAALDQYFDRLAAARIDDRSVARGRPWRAVLTCLLGWPLFAFGRPGNGLPAVTVRQLMRRVSIDVEYHSTVQVLAGMLIFPLYYIGLLAVLTNWTSTAVAALIVLALPVAGYFARFFLRHWDVLRRWWRWTRLQPAEQAAFREGRAGLLAGWENLEA